MKNSLFLIAALASGTIAGASTALLLNPSTTGAKDPEPVTPALRAHE